jgi:hypothetical protein
VKVLRCCGLHDSSGHNESGGQVGNKLKPVRRTGLRSMEENHGFYEYEGAPIHSPQIWH